MNLFNGWWRKDLFRSRCCVPHVCLHAHFRIFIFYFLGHQLSPPAPTPPPTGPASGHQQSSTSHRTGLWSSAVTSSPHPPPTGPASGRQLSLQAASSWSPLPTTTQSSPLVWRCARTTGTAICHTGQKPFPEREPQESVRPWQRVPCHPEVVCRPVGSSVHRSVQQVAGAMPRPSMLQDLHHSAGSQEAQHSKPERLSTGRSDLCGHESVRAPGSQVPQGSHWSSAGPAPVRLPGQQIRRWRCRACPASHSAAPRNLRHLCQGAVRGFQFSVQHDHPTEAV